MVEVSQQRMALMISIRGCLATVIVLALLLAELPSSSASGPFEVLIKVDGVEVLEYRTTFDIPDPDQIWEDMKDVNLQPLPGFQTLKIPDDAETAVLRSQDRRGIEVNNG